MQLLLLRHIFNRVGLQQIGLLWGRYKRIMSVILHGNVVCVLDDFGLKAFAFVCSKTHIVRTSCGAANLLFINSACLRPT